MAITNLILKCVVLQVNVLVQLLSCKKYLTMFKRPNTADLKVSSKCGFTLQTRLASLKQLSKQ